MEIVGLIFGSLAIFYSLLTSQCVKNYFGHPEKFEQLNEQINLCEIAKNEKNFPKELRDEILKGDNECTLNLTNSVCNEILMEAKENFEENINRTIKSFSQDEIELTVANEKCIYQTIDEHKLVNAYLKIFLSPDIIFNNLTGNEIEMLATLVRIVKSFCIGDKLYANQFESYGREEKNISSLEPCYVQYLIDRGFMMGNLIERPTNCNDKDFQFKKFLFETLSQNYFFENFFAIEKSEILKCFIDKSDTLELAQKIIGIEYSYYFKTSEYDQEKEKMKFVELMKLKDKTYIECHVP